MVAAGVVATGVGAALAAGVDVAAAGVVEAGVVDAGAPTDAAGRPSWTVSVIVSEEDAPEAGCAVLAAAAGADVPNVRASASMRCDRSP